MPLFPLKFSYYFHREREAVGGAAAHLGELAHLLVSAMPNDTSLNAHGERERLQVGNEWGDVREVRRMDEHRAIQALLALALLLEKVVTAVALHGELSAPGAPQTLLCAAVGLELRHGRGSLA